MNIMNMSYEALLQDNPTLATSLIYSLLLLSDLSAYVYTLLKIYRILLYSKVTFDQIPLLNPYKWPFSFFRIITQPYFKLWNKLLPNLRMGNAAYDVSTIIGLEAISSIISFSLHFRAATFVQAETILSILNSWRLLKSW